MSQYVFIDFRQLQQSGVFADSSHFQRCRSSHVVAWSSSLKGSVRLYYDIV